MSKIMDRVREILRPVPKAPPIPPPVEPLDPRPSRVQLEAEMLRAQNAEGMHTLRIELNRLAGNTPDDPPRRRWPWGNGS